MLFENTDVYGFDHALRGMRNPMESWRNSDSDFVLYENGVMPVIGEKDLNRAMNLVKAGDDEGKFARKIQVWVDIEAPMYWWKEFDTYKVGVVSNSTSQMHKLGSRFLTLNDFVFDEITDLEINTVHALNDLIERWHASGKKKPSPEWRKLIQNIPQSFIYRRTVNLNYQVLKNMYHARKNHRLQEWRVFCDWIESLPYSQLITLK